MDELRKLVEERGLEVIGDARKKADLVVLKRVGLSPPYIEFKRAHLHNFNPVGCGATLGAGTTLTKDAPPDSLTISRAKQVSISGWKRPVKK